MTIKLSITINKSIDKVWSTFIDSDLWKSWYGGEINSVNPSWQKVSVSNN